MNLDYLLWPLAILCLWTPSAVVSTLKIREKIRQPARRHDDGLSSLLRSGFNWVDLVRGGLGGWLVHYEVMNYRPGQDDTGAVFMVVQFIVLFVGVVAQTIWIDKPPRIVGPVFYLIGLTLAISQPVVGGFALVLGLTLALTLRRLSLSFLLVPVGLAAFAFIFHELRPIILFNGVVFALPILLAFAFGTRVAFVRRPVELRSKSYRVGQQESDTPPHLEEIAVVTPTFAEHRVSVATKATASPSGKAATPGFLDL